ncbi:MAG: thermonuclease family protein [bacterium]
MHEHLYNYKANVVSVYDGDTCTVDIDLGMRTWVHGEKLRLFRINAPELTGVQKPAGLAARDFLRGMIAGKEIHLQTIKDKQEKYGRYLAEIFVQQGEAWVNVNDEMVKNGHAVYQDYSVVGVVANRLVAKLRTRGAEHKKQKAKSKRQSA